MKLHKQRRTNCLFRFITKLLRNSRWWVNEIELPPQRSLPERNLVHLLGFDEIG